jgi:hypothetical protein
VYESRANRYAEHTQTRHTVAATAIEDSTIVATRHDEMSRVNVRWLVNGVEQLGSVDLVYETNAGDQLDVWVDASGDLVAAPTPTWRAGVDAMLAGAGTLFIAMVGVAGLSLLVRWWLTQRRHSSWDREWRALVSDGGGRTGSQT